MTYCDIQKIRLIAGLGSDRISDSELRDFRDDVAIPKINEELNTIIMDEEVEYISTDKENNIDGSNKTFYAREVDAEYKFIGDFNDDGEVDDSDVEAFQVDDDTRTDLNVTLVDHETGELSIEKPNGDAVKDGDIFLNYSVAPADEQTPSKMVEIACAQLTGMFGHSSIDIENFNEFSIGSVTVNDSDSSASDLFSDYQKTLIQINQREVIQSGENRNNIENVFTDSGGPLNNGR